MCTCIVESNNYLRITITANSISVIERIKGLCTCSNVRTLVTKNGVCKYIRMYIVTFLFSQLLAKGLGSYR